MSFEKFQSRNTRGVRAPQLGQRGYGKKSLEKNVRVKSVSEKPKIQPLSERDKKIAEAWKAKKTHEAKKLKNKLEARRNKYNKTAEDANRAAEIEALKEKLLSHGGRFNKPNFVAETKSKPTNVGNPNPKGPGGNSEKNRTNPKKAEKIRRRQVQKKH